MPATRGGLASGAELLVKLNGQTVSSLALSGSRTGDIHDQILPIPLGSFRPGVNTLSLEAQLPAPSDATCDPGHVADTGGRFQLLDTSYLDCPRSPRSAAIPTSVTSRRRWRAGQPPRLVLVAGEGPTALTSAATLLSRLAYATGTLFDVTLADTPNDSGSTATLLVGGYADLPSDATADLGLDLGGTPAAAPAQMAGAGSAFDDGPAAPPSWSAPLTGALDTATQYLGSQTQLALADTRVAIGGLASAAGLSGFQPDATTLPSFVPGADTRLLVAQGFGNDGTTPLTLIAAPTDGELPAAVALLGPPRRLGCAARRPHRHCGRRHGAACRPGGRHPPSMPPGRSICSTAGSSPPAGCRTIRWSTWRCW